MKPFRLITIILCTILLGTVHAQTNADEVLRRVVDSQRGGTTQRATITMLVERGDRQTEYVIESVSDGQTRSLTRVVAPARDAGQAFLQDGGNLYLYNPRLRRTLRLPPSGQNDAFLGSDISYSDLAGRDLETNYSAEITNETPEQLEITLTPEPLAPTPYGKVVLIASADSYQPLEYTFYDQRGQAVRRILFSEYTQVGDLFFPTHLEVQNLLRRGERTVIRMSDYAFDIDIPSGCFREQALERGC
jgi:outer membrane lipoprotein-sorting protein